MCCSGVCLDVPICIADTSFVVDLFVTPFQGADVVLEVDWLRKLGPVTLDYSALILSFTHNSQRVVFSGETQAALSICSTHLEGTSPQMMFVNYFCCTSLPRTTTPTFPDVSRRRSMLYFRNSLAFSTNPMDSLLHATQTTESSSNQASAPRASDRIIIPTSKRARFHD